MPVTQADYNSMIAQWRKLGNAFQGSPDDSAYVEGVRKRIEKAFKAGDDQSFDAVRIEMKKRLANGEWLTTFINLAVGILAVKNQLGA